MTDIYQPWSCNITGEMAKSEQNLKKMWNKVFAKTWKPGQLLYVREMYASEKPQFLTLPVRTATTNR